MTNEEAVTVTKRRLGHAKTIVAVLADGKRQDVEIGEGKGRFVRMGRILRGLRWRQLDFYAENGSHLDSLFSDDDDADNPTPPEARPKSAQAEMMDTWLTGIDRVAQHIKAGMLETIQAQSAVITNQALQIAELQGWINDTLSTLRQAAETIHDGNGQSMDPKSIAITNALNAVVGQVTGRPVPMIGMGPPPGEAQEEGEA